MAEILIDDVHKSFGPVEVLKGVSFDIDAGRTVAVVGRSGSGKSTLLRCLNGLEKIDSGRIEIAGRTMDYAPGPLRELRKSVGIVFQSYNLFPHLRVAENVALGPRLVNRLGAGEVDDLVRSVLGKVGMLDKIGEYPSRLSGGQQQRVAIARALAMRPRVMLFDEVTSALDPELTGEVLAVMAALAKDGMTMVVVTHEMEFARRVADVTVLMHQGRIWESGSSAEMFKAPATPEFRSFLASGLK